MNELDLFNTEVKTITSREISELTGRRHGNTLTVIRSLINAKLIKEGQYEMTSYRDAQNQARRMIKLDRKASITAIAQQSPEIIARLVERWDEH